MGKCTGFHVLLLQLQLLRALDRLDSSVWELLVEAEVADPLAAEAALVVVAALPMLVAR